MSYEKIKVVKKGSFFGKLFLFLFAFILGAVSSIGAVVGVGYYAATKKSVKDIFNYAGMDYSAYITDEYAEKTVWDPVGAAYNDLSTIASAEK